MKKDYVIPEHNKLEYTCLNCGKYCLHTNIQYKICPNNASNYFIPLNESNKNLKRYSESNEKNLIHIKSKCYSALCKENIKDINFVIRICIDCGSRSYWEIINKYSNNQNDWDDWNGWKETINTQNILYILIYHQ